MGICWDDIFTISKKYYLCIVDSHCKFPVIKQVEGFSTDNLMKTCKIIFSEYKLPSKSFRCEHKLCVTEVNKISASNLAYIMQYHHHTTIKATERHA